ncbi:MAG: hypothetical protein HY532_00415 [Chloroflexi bacterium]|nr:hypothetical protein [Chloroflexota bacterium]
MASLANWWRRWPAVALASTAIAFTTIAVSGLFMFVRQSLPGEALYGIKASIEDAQLALYPSDERRAVQAVRLAERRAWEVAWLLDKGDTTRVDPTLLKLDQHLQLAVGIVASLKKESGATQVQRVLQTTADEVFPAFESLAERHNALPEDIIDISARSVRHSFTSALLAVKQVQDTIDELPQSGHTETAKLLQPLGAGDQQTSQPLAIPEGEDIVPRTPNTGVMGQTPENGLAEGAINEVLKGVEEEENDSVADGPLPEQELEVVVASPLSSDAQVSNVTEAGPPSGKGPGAAAAGKKNSDKQESKGAGGGPPPGKGPEAAVAGKKNSDKQESEGTGEGLPPGKGPDATASDPPQTQGGKGGGNGQKASAPGGQKGNGPK